MSRKINVYDKRNSQIVKTFKDIHSRNKIYAYFCIRIITLHETCCIGGITCVRWDPSGKSLASTSYDATVKVLDFVSRKVTYAGNTRDGSKYLLFILLWKPIILFDRRCSVYMFFLEKATKKRYNYDDEDLKTNWLIV